MTSTDIPAIDEARLEAFVGQAVVDMGVAISGLLLHIGDRLGLYKAMAGAGPITSSTLAQRTGTTERYVHEWLGNPAAGGYVAYNPADSTYELPAEQAMVVANEDSPVFLGGAFETIALHDMGDPVGAARRIRQALAPDGTLLLVEPNAGDALEHNPNPVGRTYYGLSTVICTPGSLAQEVGLGLGGWAGERQLAIVLREAGFTPRGPGNRDPVQHHSGGQTIGVAPIVASTDSPRARCSPPMKTSVRAHW
jgi:hypothetical protein